MTGIIFMLMIVAGMLMFEFALISCFYSSFDATLCFFFQKTKKLLIF